MNSFSYHGFYQFKPLLLKPHKLDIKFSQLVNKNLRSSSTFAELSSGTDTKKKCLRCGTFYQEKDNSPTACSFHGHTTGERGLLAMAPPHQGIDGEWSDKSGVIVYRWNEKDKRPNTGRKNWKKRWTCCCEYGDNAPPCRTGCHVSYDDGYTLF